MSDTEKPVTLRDEDCFKRIKSSFSGPIWDNAPKFEKKSDVPENLKGFTVVASSSASEPYGALMTELPVTASSSCLDGSITGRRLEGKVRVN